MVSLNQRLLKLRRIGSRRPKCWVSGEIRYIRVYSQENQLLIRLCSVDSFGPQDALFDYLIEMNMNQGVEFVKQFMKDERIRSCVLNTIDSKFNTT